MNTIEVKVQSKGSRDPAQTQWPRACSMSAHKSWLEMCADATGGAWTIGYKAWGSLLARRLSKQGLLVCCLDYRNFPQVIKVL